MAEALFYERPVALNRERHKDLRVKPLNDARFAEKVHSVPATIGDFVPAARDYVILFGGESLEKANPVVMLGLNEGENAFVDAKGKWDATTYIPSIVRRYPFVLAEQGEGGLSSVFFDEVCTSFDTDEGERLFNEDGSNTETLDNALQFLEQFKHDVERTLHFTQRLKALDLLQQQSIQDGDGNVVVHGLFVVSEDKLRELDGEVLSELMADGSLGFIYAHLLSLGNIGRLRLRVDEQAAAASRKKKSATKSRKRSTKKTESKKEEGAKKA